MGAGPELYGPTPEVEMMQLGAPAKEELYCEMMDNVESSSAQKELYYQNVDDLHLKPVVCPFEVFAVRLQSLPLELSLSSCQLCVHLSERPSVYEAYKQSESPRVKWYSSEPEPCRTALGPGLGERGCDRCLRFFLFLSFLAGG